MKVLVTGGSGFIGRYVVDELAEAGHTVSVFDTQPPKTPGIPHIRGDLTVLEQVREAMTGVEAVCHIGAIGDVYLAFENPTLAAAVNVLGTANVLEAARVQGVERVVYASTWEVYGKAKYEPVDEQHPCNPDHPYNITKLAGDLLCQSYRKLKGLDVLVLRLGTTYGPGMRDTAVLPAFILRALKGEPIIIHGTGEQFRQFTHVRDIARGFRLALEQRKLQRNIFNLAAPERIIIAEMADLVCAELPTQIIRQKARVGDIPPAMISAQTAEEELGWKALISFREGALELMRWYRRNAAFRRDDPGIPLA